MPRRSSRIIALALAVMGAGGLAACSGHAPDEPEELSVLMPLQPGLTGPRGSPLGSPFDYTGSSKTPAKPPLPSTTPSGAPNQPSGSQ